MSAVAATLVISGAATAQGNSPPAEKMPVLILPAPAPAADAPVLVVAQPSARDANAALPADTEIFLSTVKEVNSKKIRQGESFEMAVVRDVKMGDYIVIPRGTPATGTISYRTGKGAFGKSAKMEFVISALTLGDKIVPLKAKYRIEGSGNTGATVGAIVAAGVIAGVFVTGHSAVIAPATEYKAFTLNALPITLNAAASAPVVAAAQPAVAAPPVAALATPVAAIVQPVAAVVPVKQ